MSAVYPERSRRGFTLVELMVVISIISILSLIGVASFKSFSDKQPGIKAQGEVQTLLRLAQSNASTSTLCNGVGSTSWSLMFMSDKKTIELHCEPGDVTHKTYTLENAEIEEIKCGTLPASSLPVSFNYSTGATQLAFLELHPTGNTVIDASSCTVKIKNLRDTTQILKLTISKGGTINVE